MGEFAKTVELCSQVLLEPVNRGPNVLLCGDLHRFLASLPDEKDLTQCETFLKSTFLKRNSCGFSTRRLVAQEAEQHRVSLTR